MNSLTRYEKDGWQVYINAKGEVFASQGTLARMCEVVESTLRTWMGARKTMVKQTVSLYATVNRSSVFEHLNSYVSRLFGGAPTLKVASRPIDELAD